MGDRGGGRLGGRARDGILRQNVHVHPGLLVVELGPETAPPRRHLESVHGGHSQEFVQVLGRHDDVDVLRDAAEVSVTPDGPAAGNDGLSADRLQNVIEGVNHATVAAGQILGVQHMFSPGAQHVGQCELVGKQFCGDDGCH